MTPDKGCWSDTTNARLLEGGTVFTLLQPLSNNSSPWETWAFLPHPLCSDDTFMVESKPTPCLQTQDLCSHPFPLPTSSLQAIALTLFLSVQAALLTSY